VIAGAARALALAMVSTALTTAAFARADEGGRVALVIGNEDYAAPEWALESAEENAATIAAALAAAGFDVDIQLDADNAAMGAALTRFGARLADAEPPQAGFFYFAGRSVRVRSQIYLLPVDVAPETPEEVRREAPSVDLVADYLRGVPSGRAFIVLDACRAGPLTPESADAEPCARAAPFRPFVAAVAFADGGAVTAPPTDDAEAPEASQPVEAATAASGETGQTEAAAAESEDWTSLYAASLADALGRPALDAGDVFGSAGRKVAIASGGARQPRFEPGVRGAPFYFHPPTELDYEARVAESIRWDAARRLGTIEAMQDYAAAHPDGRFVDEAGLRLFLRSERERLGVSGETEASQMLAAIQALADRGPFIVAPPGKFRTFDPENMLVVETSRGRLVIELFPALAPETVARVRELAREGWLDGAAFDPVVDELFASVRLRPAAALSPVAELPDALLEQEPPVPAPVSVADSDRGRVGAYGRGGGVAFGVYKGLAMAERSDDPSETWVSLCPGVAVTGGIGGPDLESSFHIMLAEAPALDATAAPWGRVVDGLDALYDLAPGDGRSSGFSPDVIVRARVASDLSDEEAMALFATVRGMLDESSPGFAEFIASLREELGREPRVCEIRLPVVGALAAASSSPSPQER
jgi:peptidylprolyl isomerase